MSPSSWPQSLKKSTFTLFHISLEYRFYITYYLMKYGHYIHCCSLWKQIFKLLLKSATETKGLILDVQIQDIVCFECLTVKLSIWNGMKYRWWQIANTLWDSDLLFAWSTQVSVSFSSAKYVVAIGFFESLLYSSL